MGVKEGEVNTKKNALNGIGQSLTIYNRHKRKVKWWWIIDDYPFHQLTIYSCNDEMVPGLLCSTFSLTKSDETRKSVKYLI